MSLHRGQEALERYLAEQEPAVTSLDLEGFRTWLVERLAYESQDEGFRLRCRVQELEHRPDLAEARETFSLAQRELARLPEGQRMRDLLEDIDHGEKAIEGLRTALANGAGDTQREKLAGFRRRVADARHELRELHRDTPAFQVYEEARVRLEHLETSSGLRAAEAELADHQRRRGRRAGHQGVDFERLARDVLHEVVVPELRRRGETLHVLSGVTLGCARAELDHVIVRPRRRRSVEVRAIVEVKRNVNDLASGFRMRQENIAWFRGEPEGYDTTLYRTQIYQGGHFDRPAIHTGPEGEEHVFDADSFARFRRDARTGHYLKGLYFFCDRRPLLGLGALEYSKLMARIAGMPHFDPRDDDAVRALFHWLKGRTAAIQSRDVLSFYVTRKSLAGHILMWDRRASSHTPGESP